MGCTGTSRLQRATQTHSPLAQHLQHTLSMTEVPSRPAAAPLLLLPLHHSCFCCVSLPAASCLSRLLSLQKLGVLDTALAQPSTRLMLQSLPPDVLTAILSSDTLLTTSENTVIAAIDLWMAGPVAQTLAHLSDHHAASAADSCNLSSSSSQCCLGAADVTDGSNAGSSGGSSHSSSRSSLQQQSLEHSSREDSSSAERGVNSGQEQLLAAQMLLLGAVRLNQCSGGFLAAAVERMPWLCRALQDRAADLQLLEQYCRYGMPVDMYVHIAGGCHGRVCVHVHVAEGWSQCL